VFVNLVGGLKLADTALDAAVAAAVMSSYTGIPLRRNVVIFGEVGLGGKLRAVPQAEKRVVEAAKYGFSRVVMPRERGGKSRASESRTIDGVKVQVIRCRTVQEALAQALVRPLPPPGRRKSAPKEEGSGEDGRESFEPC
jgi:predicted ATP-dependent serine protease